MPARGSMRSGIRGVPEMPDSGPVTAGWRLLERLVLPSRRLPGVSVLIFHQVLARKDPLRPNEPDAREFEGLVRFLSRRFRLASLRDAVRAAGDGSADPHVVAITFDDGYANNLEVAMPILERYGAPATFFITTDPLDTGIMWNDRVLHAVRSNSGARLDLRNAGLGSLPTTNDQERRGAYRSLISQLKYLEIDRRSERVAEIEIAADINQVPRLMMTREQVRTLADRPGASIGGHTETHPILARLPRADAEREIAAGKERLEEIIGRKINSFAYPNGVPDSDYRREHVDIVRDAGFELAVSTSTGSYRQGWDPYQVPRIKPWDKLPWRFGLRLLLAARNDGMLAGAGGHGAA